MKENTIGEKGECWSFGEPTSPTQNIGACKCKPKFSGDNCEYMEE